jgi:hypothetical protein
MLHPDVIYPYKPDTLHDSSMPPPEQKGGLRESEPQNQKKDIPEYNRM